MLCPVCHVELAMSERQGIEIDYCPQCRGVWLDRGELDKIIERTAPKSKGYRKEARDNYHYDDEYEKPKRGHKDKDYRPRRKKRDSILEEIFDIFD